MARPERSEIIFEIDGREVRAAEGSMLVDAAKRGDVEIPYFCYERKLGQPVGACRMCLVEIEGMPKLQTACSTPVKDGMVVTTTSDQVKQAQNAVVEFLLVNHPLDCPVCDKGGECPLQDISFGWGAGRSRFIEPKRHFKKPLELSPLVAIDRERCILCYRCVRFSQEVAEDHQLVFLERGDHTFVGTHHGRRYVAPFSGNIIELCPVGALTSSAYRFRARPWDIEDSGSLCALCPSQCNIKFTVRDDSKVVRVLARDNEEVDDGWLCDKGRFAYESIHAPERITAPLVRDGGYLREVSWRRALDEAASALQRAGDGTAALVGGHTTNEEGFLVQHLLRSGLGSPHLDSAPGDVRLGEQARILARTDVAAKVADIDHAGAVLVVDTELVDEAPILDLRVRKAVRRNGTKLVVATSRPSSLDTGATATIRFAPGLADTVLAELGAEIGSSRGGAGFATQGGASAEDVRAAAEALRGADDVVVIWGERVAHAERGEQGVEALLALTTALGLGDKPESGLIEVPAGTNGRGLREVGCARGLAPGLNDAGEPGMSAADMARAEHGALLLVHVEPASDLREGALWEQALAKAGSVIAFAGFQTEALQKHADVVFPAESHAEKEGTLTHPDGRLQRLRQAIGHPREVRAGWWVLAELCERAGAGVDADTPPALTEKVAEAVPFYGGITLEEIGGGGVRWQERGAASSLPTAQPSDAPLQPPPELPQGLRLGVRPSLWAGPETEHSPSLRFLASRPRAELSPDDARRLGIAPGDHVVVSVNGSSVRAAAAVRSAVNAGDVFLVGGKLPGGPVEVTKA